MFACYASSERLLFLGRYQPVSRFLMATRQSLWTGVGALLASKFKVEAILAVDTKWLPSGVENRLILPSSFSRSTLRAAWPKSPGPPFGQRATVVVVVTRSWYDQLALALMAAAGARIIVIAHDPVPKQPLPSRVAFSRRLLWRRAVALVTHSAQLAAEPTAACGRAAETIPHLPFTEYAVWARKAAPDARTAGRCGLLILGQMREDKGLDRIPAILELIPARERRRFSLSFAGRGNCSKIVEVAARLVTVTRVPVEGPLATWKSHRSSLVAMCCLRLILASAHQGRWCLP
jgi:hypothetical protein